MKVKTVNLLITLGPMTTVSKCVWAWEAEVLQEKFGGQCAIGDEGEADIPQLPNAGGEFSRLQDAHGVDEDTRVPHVENTFGRGKVGIRELEKAMQSSLVKAKKKPGPKKKVAAKKPKAPKSDSESEKDPLLA